MVACFRACGLQGGSLCTVNKGLASVAWIPGWWWALALGRNDKNVGLAFRFILTRPILELLGTCAHEDLLRQSLVSLSPAYLGALGTLVDLLWQSLEPDLLQSARSVCVSGSGSRTSVLFVSLLLRSFSSVSAPDLDVCFVRYSVRGVESAISLLSFAWLCDSIYVAGGASYNSGGDSCVVRYV